MKTKYVLLLLLCLFWGGAASAFPYKIDPFVNGADMAGIEVTAYFDNDTSETATWIATGAESGGAFGTAWKLFESGDTLNQRGMDPAWTLENNTGNFITAFEIDAWVAGIFFDVKMEPCIGPNVPNCPYDEHTPGSRQGRPFTPDGTLAISNVVYSDLLNAPDLYGELEVDFAGGGLGAGQSFQFMIDTDQIPESPLYALLAMGLTGFFFQQRAKRKVAWA